ncbi:olfactory receptor 10AG1-like [Vombatus ursinus]|uniref:olfactory receptor 10AG1-like n=1 Tax=Vombatus ursinus TaxID=29139 RepID=UPI000FFD4BDD|nr:olfactory receptor 10AG1-like [Vombatus ursinus]
MSATCKEIKILQPTKEIWPGHPDSSISKNIRNKTRIARENLTFRIEFILLGFSDFLNIQGFLFVVILVIYMSILLGNGLIIIITNIDPDVQTPMYFFLKNLSFLEICYTSVMVPRMLKNLWTQSRNISFIACAVQFYFFLVFRITESLLLAAMAFDHYVTICKPLYYPVIMNHKKQVQLVIGSWISGIPVEIQLTYQIFSLPFCGSNKLNNVFCDIPPLMKIVCGDITMSELFIFVNAVVFVIPLLLLILVSYIKIITTILKLPSVIGRHKAFSTYSSHFMVVELLFGSEMMAHWIPKCKKSKGIDKLLSLVYCIGIPMFNPLMYSLRNKDIIAALKKILPK